MSWARLLKRVFDLDLEHCANCGGALKIIAAIDDPPVIARLLAHLGLPRKGTMPTRAPPRSRERPKCREIGPLRLINSSNHPRARASFHAPHV